MSDDWQDRIYTEGFFGVARPVYQTATLENLGDVRNLRNIDFGASPLPDSFMPEMTTRKDPITDNELRIGHYRDRKIGAVVELGYVLSTRNQPEWRLEQPKRDAELRELIWYGIEAARLASTSSTARQALQEAGLMSLNEAVALDFLDSIGRSKEPA
jgi:hypothetical protein